VTTCTATCNLKNIGFISTRIAGTDGVSLEMVETNYQIATHYYSYDVLRRKLVNLLPDCEKCVHHQFD